MDDTSDLYEAPVYNFNQAMGMPPVCIEIGCNGCIGVHIHIHVRLQKCKNRFTISQC